MSREVHVRFRENVAVKFRRVTRPVVESFFGSMKQEHVFFENFKTRETAKQSIFEWIEVFYNRQRLHSTLGYCSPERYEQVAKAA